MKLIRRFSRRVLLATALLIPVTVGLTATAAQATYTPYPYHKCGNIHQLGWPAECTAWTGGYPNGVVRVESNLAYEGLKLQVCNQHTVTSACWTTVASATGTPLVTPSVATRSYRWGTYRMCSRASRTAGYYCGNLVYLGD